MCSDAWPIGNASSRICFAAFVRLLLWAGSFLFSCRALPSFALPFGNANSGQAPADQKGQINLQKNQPNNLNKTKSRPIKDDFRQSNLYQITNNYSVGRANAAKEQYSCRIWSMPFILRIGITTATTNCCPLRFAALGL